MQPAPKRRSLPHTLFCVCIALFGAFVAYEGMQLSFGTLARIGPGFFPAGLGLVILLLGLLTIIEKDDAAFERHSLRPLVLCSLAILVFALTVERLGMIFAVTAVVALSSLAHGNTSVRAIAGLAALLCLTGYVLFITMLRIPLNPVF